MTGIVAQNVARTSGLIKSAGGGGGVWTLIKTLTASADATLSFVDGASDVVLDSTYPIYVFKFINMHPETDAADFSFQTSTDSGSSYGVTCTSTYFTAYNHEGDAYRGLTYDGGGDLAQSTSFQRLSDNTKNDNDSSVSGNLYLYSPSSTTFVKHFLGRLINMASDPLAYDGFSAGYFNTTSAVDAVQFKFHSGDIDAGKIKLYGLKDSA